MTVVMAVIVARHADNIAEAFAIVFLGGAIQVLLGVIRVGRYVSGPARETLAGLDVLAACRVVTCSRPAPKRSWLRWPTGVRPCGSDQV
jgi:hypothetical protein